MNCPRCGENCRCPSEPAPPLKPGLKSNSGEDLSTSRGLAARTESSPDASSVDAGPEQSDVAWRGELSARLSRYRARHNVRPPRYPSLRLPFDRFDPLLLSSNPQPSLSSFAPISNQALALDRGEHGSPDVLTEPHRDDPAEPVAAAVPTPAFASAAQVHAGAKIIEFPRFAWEPPQPPSDQLAEPVIDRPRILDVPEVTPPPPALGGISIEPAERADSEKRPGIDIPLQSASLSRRILASLLDGIIVIAASSMFGTIFWKITGICPPQMQLLELACGIPCLFWFAYQYLLIVYAGRTAGLRAAGLELAHFDGTPTSRSLRRWRVFASYLSAASLGMGYAWVFLDEDTLCWHDRITHTYLAPRKAASDKATRQQNRCATEDQCSITPS